MVIHTVSTQAPLQTPTSAWQGRAQRQRGAHALSTPASALLGTGGKGRGAPTHHGEGHTVDLVLVLRLVLPKGAVPAAVRGEENSVVPTRAHLRPPVSTGSPPEQLEEHAAQREPVGAAVVRHSFLQHLRSHVPMGAPAGAQSGVRGCARQAGRAGRGAGTLTHWHGASFWRSRKPGPGLRCGRAQTRPGGCLPAAKTPCHP